MADFLLINREQVLITEDQIRHDFAGIHARAREGGYPFDELKAMQDQVVELYAAHPDSPVGFLGFYPHNSAVPRQASARWAALPRTFRFPRDGIWPIGCSALASVRALPAAP